MERQADGRNDQHASHHSSVSPPYTLKPIPSPASSSASSSASQLTSTDASQHDRVTPASAVPQFTSRSYNPGASPPSDADPVSSSSSSCSSHPRRPSSSFLAQSVLAPATVHASPVWCSVPPSDTKATDTATAECRTCGWRFWHPEHRLFRFFILFLATLVPFGGHVIKYILSSLQNEMLEDEEFGLTHTQLGMFQSAVSVPNLFVPLLGGLILDQRGSRSGTLAMLLLCAIGHLGFIVSCYARHFPAALFSRIIFGLGQGSTVVAQGRICAQWFVGREIVFAVALTESTHNMANAIAFLYVVPVSEWMGGYVYALWFGMGFCILSLAAGWAFFKLDSEAEPTAKQMALNRRAHVLTTQQCNNRHEHRHGRGRNVEHEEESADEEEPLMLGDGSGQEQKQYDSFASSSSSRVSSNDVEKGSRSNASHHSRGVVVVSPISSVASEASDIAADPAGTSDTPSETSSCLTPLGGLTIGFAILCILHMVFSNCYHLFAYVSASMIYQRYHTTVAHAGWLAGLSHVIAIFLCPIAGIIMDVIGYKMWILAFCGALTTFAYILLLWSVATPVPSLLMLAVCITFTPTILKASVPNLVLPAVYGTAYGIYSIMESVGSVLGNTVVGFIRDQTQDWDLDLQIFASMGVIATVLSLVLIFLDAMQWSGLGARNLKTGKALSRKDLAKAGLGALNRSSYVIRQEADRMKSAKDRYLRKELKWRQIQEEEAREARRMKMSQQQKAEEERKKKQIQQQATHSYQLHDSATTDGDHHAAEEEEVAETLTQPSDEV